MALRITHRPSRQHPLIVRLSSGFRRFQHRWYHPEEPLFQELRHGQNPQALVIACSDSRVDPVLLTDSRPGDLFVVRNVANLVLPYVPGGGALGQSAALEYAVKHLQVRDIIVMGHACCGGIHALVKARARYLAGELRREAEEDEFIGPWVSVAVRAIEKVEELDRKAGGPGLSSADKARACELWSVRFSLENLLTFPWVREAVDEGRLCLHGWYFDLQSGELLEYDEESESFRALVGRPHVHEHEEAHHAERHPDRRHADRHHADHHRDEYGDTLWAHYDSRVMEDAGPHGYAQPRSRHAGHHAPHHERHSERHHTPHPEHHREHLPRVPHGHVPGRHD